MKIFERGENWSERINFVDDNNVFVGFDYSQSCCEGFGYHVTKEKPVPGQEIEDLDGTEFPGFNFDTSIQESDLIPDSDAGGSITFRLTNGEDEIWLTLYNYHNGYYGHGWEMREGGEDGKAIVTGGI